MSTKGMELATRTILRHGLATLWRETTDFPFLLILLLRETLPFECLWGLHTN